MIILWVISTLAVASVSHETDSCPSYVSYYCGCNIIDLPVVQQLKMCLYGSICQPCPIPLQENISCDFCPLNECPICSLQNFGMGRFSGGNQTNMTDSEVLEQKFVRFSLDEGIFHLELQSNYQVQPNSYYFELNHENDMEDMNDAEADNSQRTGILEDRREGYAKTEMSAGETGSYKLQPNSDYPVSNFSNDTEGPREAIQKLKNLEEHQEEHSKKEKSENETDGIHQSIEHSRFRRYVESKAESYNGMSEKKEKYRSIIQKDNAISKNPKSKYFNFEDNFRDFKGISGSKEDGKILKFSPRKISPLANFENGIKIHDEIANNVRSVAFKFRKGKSNIRKINKDRKVNERVLPPLDRSFNQFKDDEMRHNLVSYTPILKLNNMVLDSNLKTSGKSEFSFQISGPIEKIETYSGDKCFIKNILNETEGSLSARRYDFQCFIAVSGNILADLSIGEIILKLAETEDIFLLKENIKNCFSDSMIKLYNVQKNTAFVDKDCPIPIPSELLLETLRDVIKLGPENSRMKLIQGFNVPQNTGLVERFVVIVYFNNLARKKLNTSAIAFDQYKTIYDLTGQLKLDMQFYFKKNSDAKPELLNETEYDRNLLLDFSLLTNDTFEKEPIFLPWSYYDVADSKKRSLFERENVYNFSENFTKFAPQLFPYNIERDRNVSLDPSLREMFTRSKSNLSSEDIYRMITLKFPWISPPSHLNPLKIHNPKSLFFFNMIFDLYMPLLLGANARKQYDEINYFTKEHLTSPITGSSDNLFTQKPEKINSDAKNIEDNGKVFAYRFQRYAALPKKDTILEENLQNNLNDSIIFDILNISVPELKQLNILNSNCTTCSAVYKLMLDSGRALDPKIWKENTNSSFLVFMNEPKLILHSNTSKIPQNVTYLMNESIENQTDPFIIQTNIELIFMTPEKYEEFKTLNNTALEKTNWSDLNTKFILRLPESFSSQCKLLNNDNSHIFSYSHVDPFVYPGYFAEHSDLLQEIDEVVLAVLAKIHGYHGLSEVPVIKQDDSCLTDEILEGPQIFIVKSVKISLKNVIETTSITNTSSHENIVPGESVRDTIKIHTNGDTVNIRKSRYTTNEVSFKESNEGEEYEEAEEEDAEEEDAEEEDAEEEEPRGEKAEEEAKKREAEKEETEEKDEGESERKYPEKEIGSLLYSNRFDEPFKVLATYERDLFSNKWQDGEEIQEPNFFQTENESNGDFINLLNKRAFDFACGSFDENVELTYGSDYKNITDEKETGKNEKQHKASRRDYQKRVLRECKDGTQTGKVIVHEIENLLNLSSPDAGVKEMIKMFIAVRQHDNYNSQHEKQGENISRRASKQSFTEDSKKSRCAGFQLHMEDLEESNWDEVANKTSLSSSNASVEPVQFKNEDSFLPLDVDIAENEIPEERPILGRRLLQYESTEPYVGDDDDDRDADDFDEYLRAESEADDFDVYHRTESEADDFDEYHRTESEADDFDDYHWTQSEADDFVKYRRRRSVPENKWCTISNSIHHGDMECTFWTYKKSCILKCHPGYDYDGKPEQKFECGRKRDAWEPSMKSCVNSGTKADKVPESKIDKYKSEYDSPADEKSSNSEDSDYEERNSVWEKPPPPKKEKAKSHPKSPVKEEPVGKKEGEDYHGHYMNVGDGDGDDDETPFEYYNYKAD